MENILILLKMKKLSFKIGNEFKKPFHSDQQNILSQKFIKIAEFKRLKLILVFKITNEDLISLIYLYTFFNQKIFLLIN